MEQNNTGKINIKLWFEKQKKKSVEMFEYFRKANLSIDEEAGLLTFLIIDDILGQNLNKQQTSQIKKLLDEKEFEKAAELLWKIYNKEV